ncbi:sialidase family protein [Ornatilinea apprima]|nr:sialidase family protein [Ornatilinea apprima]
MHAKKLRFLKPFWGILGLVLVFSMSFPVGFAHAQSGSGDWSEPINISVSGGAINPSAVMDSKGNIHVIWEDIYSGFMYIQYKEGMWTIPESVFFPFLPLSSDQSNRTTNNLPVFVANGKGLIHAFWLDSRGVLYHSYVIESSFNQSASWLPRQALSESVTKFNVISDDQGNIHLAYVKSSSSSFERSGIVYRKQMNGIWQTPIQIFESNYFRRLTSAEANVQVESVNTETGQRVYLFWDNQPSNSVLGAFSDDGGRTWSDYYQVDGPSSQRETERFIQVRSSAKDKNIMLVWKSDQLGQSCTQYYQYSQDGGLTWQEKQPIIHSLNGCVSDYDVIAGENGLFLMSSQLMGLKYFSIWNGEDWSEPGQQAILDNYIDPSNYNLVTFSSNRLLMLGGNQIAVVASSSDNQFPGDIWWLTRNLGEIDDWKGVGTNWTTFNRITAPKAPLLDTSIAEDDKGRFHFISVADSSSAETLIDREIFYSRWEEGEWSVHTGVISSPEGDAGAASVDVAKNNQLGLVWSDTRGENLFFSHASADRALSSSAWSTPIKISHSASTVNNPQIIITDQNVYFIVYSSPLNTGRGIYLVRSDDGGETWQSEKTIAEGEENQWLRVGNPKVASSDGLNVFALWKVYPFIDNENYTELYYSSSNDSGTTWAVPQKVDEGQIFDHTILSDGFGNIHRYWRKVVGSTTQLIHNYSGNQGVRWVVSPAISLMNLPIDESTRLAVSKAGNVSLIQVNEDLNVGNWGINSWDWVDGKWLVGSSNSIRLQGNEKITDLAVAINPKSQKQIVLLFSSPTNFRSTENEYSFYSTFRDVENLKELPEAETIEVTIVPTVAAQPTIFTATPTAVDLSEYSTNTPAEANTLPGIIIGVVGGMIVVGLFLYLQFRPKKP